MTGYLIEPGSGEWLMRMSPSKGAAVLGVSPYDSPQSLWRQMAGVTPTDPTTTRQSRGHYLEPAILAWWFDQHPDFEWIDTKDTSFLHPTLGWVANLDAAGRHRETGEMVTVEAKSDAGEDDRWGTPGTDEMPPHIVCQNQISMHITGHRRAYVPVLGSRLEFKEYVVDYDEEWATQVMEPALVAFTHSIILGVEPALDAHPATYESIKKSSPDIDGSYIKLSPELAIQYVTTRDAAKAAQDAADIARNEVLRQMGLAQFAYCGGVKVARRQRGRGAPAFYDGRASVAQVTAEIDKKAAA